MTPHFHLPVNLGHAATVASRLANRLGNVVPDEGVSEALEQANLIVSELQPYRLSNDEPSTAETMVVQAHILDLARHLVRLIEFEGHRTDRLGQAVRNLFECLGRGKEGADMGLRAGEDPNSLQRPR